MISLALQRGYWWCLLVCLLCFNFFICDVRANETVQGTVFVNGKRAIAKTDENFICATLDWWPSDNCANGTCSWRGASLLNLDLNNAILLKAIKAFSPLKIRLGGTLQDQVIYQTERNRNLPCIPFRQDSSHLFNYSEGCLPLARWDELNNFFNRSRALITFGLNALNGRIISRNRTGLGPWDSTNAASLIRYTVKKGYNVYGWELGNELGGVPIGIAVAAEPYASDTIVLHRLVQNIYKGFNIKPLIIAPGGTFEYNWFKRFVDRTEGSLNVITHHIYNLGRATDENLVERIVNASALDGVIEVYKNVSRILKSSKSSTVAWVGESGGVSRSGRDGVSNAFVFSFWYLDQLGMASVYDTKTHCRQSLVGGNYGLLNTTTFVPNPDYYSALLWHRLMGKNVLSTRFGGTRKIRSYAHCAKHSSGVTVLLINLDGNTTVQAKLDFNGRKVSEAAREEYHLTPMNGNIQSRTVLLNGKALTLDSDSNIPAMKPIRVTNSSKPIRVHPFSIVFVHIPNIAVPACERT